MQQVIAAAAEQTVRPAAAQQRIVKPGTGDRVRAGAAAQDEGDGRTCFNHVTRCIEQRAAIA